MPELSAPVAESRARRRWIDSLMWYEGRMGVETEWGEADGVFAPADDPEQPLPSIVVVAGPPDKYSDEELERLAEFSRERTDQYRRESGPVRWGANLICIDKREEFWFHKRVKWKLGRVTSLTFDDTLARMSR